MKNWLSRAVFAVALLASITPAWAGSKSPPGISCGPMLVEPIGAGTLPQLVQQSTSNMEFTDAAAGVIRCSPFVAPCNGAFTKLGFNVQAATTNAEGDVGIYSSSYSKLGSTGPQDGSSLVPNGNRSKTSGLNIPLVAGQRYQICWSANVNSGMKLTSASPISTLGAWAGQFNVAGGVVAQFALQCTSAATPYPCCTGNGTGTSCPGLPDSFSTTTTATTTAAPMVVLGR